MSDDKSFVDQIILENRLAQERVDKLFERLDGCEKRLKNVSIVLDRIVDQVNLMQPFQSADCGPRSPASLAYNHIPDGCGDNIIGDYHRAIYEQSMRRERKSPEQSTDGKQEE